MTTSPIIYNLFPRLAGPMQHWPRHADRAASMGFNWIYLNPLHFPGFSASLYAVKDYYRVNPDFLPPHTPGDGLDALRAALASLRERGLRPMMDLVVNHTAKDSALVEQHPAWYVWEGDEVASPFAVDPDDSSKRTVWGDLGEIDNERSADRAGLWAYWADLVRHSLDLGFEGFRCDAAYQVPAGLWRHLVDVARQLRPDCQFFAETLGCTVPQVLALSEAGFDYIFNSSKWWDFRQAWALEQHEAFGRIAPSIAFPESHDTERLAAATGGDQAIQRQRYAFAAAFSAGLMLPIGCEYGFRRRLNVVSSKPEDWESPSFDLTGFVGQVNRLKLATPLLRGEGTLRTILPLEEDVLMLERTTDEAPGQKGWIIVNKHPRHNGQVTVPQDARATQHRVHRVSRDGTVEPIGRETIALSPSEVVFVLPV